MQGIIELSQNDIMGLAFVAVILLVSSPFLASRIKARKQWKVIKNSQNLENSLERRSGIEFLRAAAENRRYLIGNMIRQDEMRRQTINIVILLVVHSLVKLAFEVPRYMTITGAMNMDILVTAFLSLMLAPIFYFYFMRLFKEAIENLNTLKQELGVKGRLQMSDIADVEFNKLNSFDTKVFGD